MLKKFIIIILLAVISLSLYTVFVNLSLEWEYNQDVNALRRNYSVNDKLSTANLKSSSIPTPLINFIKFSTINRNKFPLYISVNYSGQYQENAHSSKEYFAVKSFYSVKDSSFVSDWKIEHNRILFSKITEKLTGREKMYEKNLYGIKKEAGVYGFNAAYYLNTRFMFDAVYFPYYYLSNNCIRWEYTGRRQLRITLGTAQDNMIYNLKFNEDNSLNSISTERFAFKGDTVKYTAFYDNYSIKNSFRIPNNIRVVCEKNFNQFTLYNAYLNNIEYR
ncbi:MAG: DUF6544 family protein [Halanaerobium sp.]